MPCLRLRDAEKLMAEMAMTLGVPVSMPPMSGTLAKLLHDVAIGAARDVVGIWCGAISGNMRLSFQAARSIG